MKNNIANLDYWYKYGDDRLGYYGGHRHRSFRQFIKPLNSGKSLELEFLLDKDLDMAGTFDEIYLTLKDCDINAERFDKVGVTYRLGDSGFEEWVGMAVSLLMILNPKLLNLKAVDDEFCTDDFDEYDIYGRSKEDAK